VRAVKTLLLTRKVADLNFTGTRTSVTETILKFPSLPSSVSVLKIVKMALSRSYHPAALYCSMDFAGYVSVCVQLYCVGFHCLPLHVSAYMAIFRSVGYFIFICLKDSETCSERQ
jgi:hypothetical protein